MHKAVFLITLLAAAPAGAQPAAAPTATAQAERLQSAPATLRTTVEAQVRLDRAGFAPGVIDGRMGDNMAKALRAYQEAMRLPVTGRADRATLERLRAGDEAPVLTSYRLSAEDVAGPFVPEANGEDYAELARLERLGFTSPREAVAEKFHADEAFLARLNPGRDFGREGEEIIVPAVGRKPLAAKVARIEVRKAASQVRVFDGGGRVLAVYPATIGSAALPSPEGTMKVRAVAPAPSYTYDPARLTKATQGDRKLTLAPGPNNPVGATWIDLTQDTYGIHGTPEPRLIGKRASSGCVRLTNWDAWQLEKSVEAGAVVEFVS